MTCQEIKNQLHLFWDNELSKEERGMVENHLSQCPSCQKESEKIMSINSIGKAKIFVEPGDEYWQKLTTDIMKKINPTTSKQAVKEKLFGTLVSIIWPEKINYRIAGLSIATIVLLLIVKISFFDRGKYNVPMELENQQTIKEIIPEKKNTEALPARQPELNTLPSVRDGVNLALPSEQIERPAALEKSGRGTALLTKETPQKICASKETAEAAEFETPQSDKIELPTIKFGSDAKSFEKANEQISNLDKNKFDAASREMPVVLETISSAQSGAKAIPAADTKTLKAAKIDLVKGKSELHTVAFQADEIAAAEDSFLVIQKQLSLLKAVEDKILFLKTYLNRHPGSAYKNQLLFLLAENMVHRAEETKSEQYSKEVIDFFYFNQDELKTCEVFENLAKKITKLETTLKKFEKK